VNPDGFLADIQQTPHSLKHLADALDGAMVSAPDLSDRRVVLLGMGSSRFATSLPVAIGRSRGLDVIAEFASAELGTAAGQGVLAVAVSASGGSKETLLAAERHRSGESHVVALTEASESALVELAHEARPLLAGAEDGGVACRSYAHTVAVLLAWVDAWTGSDARAADDCRRAAEALSTLHADLDNWLPEVAAALDGPHGVVTIAPAERIGTALQGALMVREGPRRGSDAGETGDWSHVDVYLTKTMDYRALLHSGSAWDAEALTWMRDRKSTFVTVGPGRPGTDYSGAAFALRYPYDNDVRVATIVETAVLELVAQRWWASGATPSA